MTALYNIASLRLPHVNIYRWASEQKIIVPFDFQHTSEEVYMFLKLQAMKQFYISGTPEQEQARFKAAVKEYMEHYAKDKFSDRTVLIVQIAGTVIFGILVHILPKL